MLLLFTFIYFKNSLKLSGGENDLETFIRNFKELYPRIEEQPQKPKFYGLYILDIAGLYYVMNKIRSNIKSVLVIDDTRKKYTCDYLDNDNRFIDSNIYGILESSPESKTDVSDKSVYVMNLFRILFRFETVTNIIPTFVSACDSIRLFKNLNITYKKILYVSENPSSVKSQELVQLCKEYIESVNKIQLMLTHSEIEYLKFLYEIELKPETQLINYADINRQFTLMLYKFNDKDEPFYMKLYKYHDYNLVHAKTTLYKTFFTVYTVEHEEFLIKKTAYFKDYEETKNIFIKNLINVCYLMIYIQYIKADVKSIPYDFDINYYSHSILFLGRIQKLYYDEHVKYYKNTDDINLINKYISILLNDPNYHILSMHSQTCFQNDVIVLANKPKLFLSLFYRFGEQGQLYISGLCGETTNYGEKTTITHNLMEVTKNKCRFLGVFKENITFTRINCLNIYFGNESKNSNAGMRMLLELYNIMQETFNTRNSFDPQTDMIISFGLKSKINVRNPYVVNDRYACSPVANYAQCPNVIVEDINHNYTFVCDVSYDKFYLNYHTELRNTGFIAESIDKYVDKEKMLHPFMLINKACIYQAILKVILDIDYKHEYVNFMDVLTSLDINKSSIVNKYYDVLHKFILNIPVNDNISITYRSKFMNDNIFRYVSIAKNNWLYIVESAFEIMEYYIKKHFAINEEITCHKIARSEVNESGQRTRSTFRNYLCLVQNGEIIHMLNMNDKTDAERMPTLSSEEYNTLDEFANAKGIDKSKITYIKSQSYINYHSDIYTFNFEESVFQNENESDKLEVLCFLITKVESINALPPYLSGYDYNYISKNCVFELDTTIQNCIETVKKWCIPFANYIGELFQTNPSKTIGELITEYIVYGEHTKFKISKFDIMKNMHYQITD